MGIDMSKYKMIYKNRVYNCISLIVIHCVNREGESESLKLQVTYINESNRIAIIEDSNDEFQFVLR